MKQDFFELGTLVKTHGIHGELILEAKNPELIENIKESVFVEIDGIPVPFFIAEFKPASHGRLRVKFDWIDSEFQAKKLTNRTVHLRTSEIDHASLNFDDNYDLLKGFKVIDTKLGELGIISHIIENPVNPLMAVIFKRKEILIPLHPDLIKNIKSKARTITVNCPEGLIDLYFD